MRWRATPRGGSNTATGVNALASNTTGISNTAVGAGALFYLTTGTSNTAVGSNALGNCGIASTVTQHDNTAVGVAALGSNSGSSNTAIGGAAMAGPGPSSCDLSPASGNTAVGFEALVRTVGNYNISLGPFAGDQLTMGSNNIEIGNRGMSNDDATIRIGASSVQFPNSAVQTRAFIAGIRGATTGNNDAVPVMIDSSGQLGTVNSARRFKEDINDMGDTSNGLMRLRPVTFRYQKPFEDGSKPIQYGLIAEEVAEVYPDLVAHSADGQVETVKYQVLDSMLLNEVQRQEKLVDEQKSEIGVQKDQIRAQNEQIQALEERLARLEVLIAAASR